MEQSTLSYEITGHTRLICLLGSPVAHSKSPLMHNESFRRLGLDFCYLAFETPEAALEKTVEGLKLLNCRGFNLTMPCKNKMAALCDHLSPAAQICGAVNTVVNDGGVLTGHTTDGVGFLRSLREAGQKFTGKKMVLLGTGGAGTAILVQSALDGLGEIAVFSRMSGPHAGRTVQITESLKARTSCQISLHDYASGELRRQIASADFLVNATNIGMAPEMDRCLIPDASWLSPKLFVADIIYNPAETKLLQMAKSVGCQTINGLPMLLYQGAEAFHLWTGQEMPVAAVKEKYFS